MDNQILSLYAKGMTTREIAAAFKELYDADASPALVSKVTDAVMEQVTEWQNRPLDAVYPIVYLDCIVLKVRQDSRVINKSVFLAGYQHRSPERTAGYVAGRKRGREVLAQCADRTEKKRPERYPHRLCRRAERLPGRHQHGLSGSPHPVMHRAYGAQQSAVPLPEGLQSCHPRPESHLSGPPRKKQASRCWKRSPAHGTAVTRR